MQIGRIKVVLGCLIVVQVTISPMILVISQMLLLTLVDGLMIGNRGMLVITHIGMASLHTTLSQTPLTLHNVLHAPSITTK